MAELENFILTIIVSVKFLFKTIHIFISDNIALQKGDLQASLAGLNTVGTTI